MVHSVLAVSTVGKLKREDNRSGNSSTKKNEAKAKDLFSQILEAEVAGQKATPMTCKTVTYGQDSKIHTFEYQTREYR